MVASLRAVLGGSALLVLMTAFACGGSSAINTGKGAGARGGSGGGAGAGAVGSLGGTGGTAGSPPGDCPAFTPCGGDVLGAWRIVSICGAFTPESNPDVPECAGTAVSESFMGDGVYTFQDDGTATLTGTITVTADEVVTDACSQAQYGFSAALLCAGLNASNDLPQGQAGADGTGGATPAISFMCTVDGTDCACHIVEGPVPVDQSATYSVQGEQITIGSNTSDYCVDGDTLTIQGTSASTGLTQIELTRN
jgi:hypothetical protein